MEEQGKYIQSIESEYQDFMKLDSFPTYGIIEKDVSLEDLDNNKYLSAASAEYDVKTGRHSLTVIKGSKIPKFLLFHEFTHILDSERYVQGDKIRNVGISGYSEYHASQIELLQLIGASSVDSVHSFSMQKVIFALDQLTVIQYLNNKRSIAMDMFKEIHEDDINDIAERIGVLYNYFGLRSICKMYASDFYLEEDNSKFMEIIPSWYFSAINNSMNGWLDESQINRSMEAYLKIMSLLYKRNHG